MKKLNLLLAGVIALGLFTEAAALSTQQRTSAFNQFVEQRYRDSLELEKVYAPALQCGYFTKQHHVYTLHSELAIAPDKEKASKIATELLEYYEPIARTSPSRSLANRAKEEAASLKLLLDQKEEARRLAQEVLKEYPRSPKASEVLGRLCLEKTGQLKAEGRYQEALQEYQELIHADVAEMWQATARYLTASHYLKRGDEETALRLYEEIPRAHPHLYEWGARVRYKIAEHHQQKKDPRRARAAYERLLSEYPRSSWAPAAGEQLKELP